MANRRDILISFILAFHNALPINTCFTGTNSCPTTRQDWMVRKKEFGQCSSLYQQYACMLTANGTLGEACINTYDIPPGVVGCPFIQACSSDVGPTITIPQDFKKCPTRSFGCPTEEHVGYTVHELYKYPACLVRNRIFTSSPETTESNITMSTRGKPDERKGTTVIALSIIFTILSLLAVGLVVYCVVKRKRRQRNNRFTFCCRTVDKAILDGGDNGCDTSLMSAMVESSNVKPMSDQRDARKIVSAETPKPNEVYLYHAAIGGDVQRVRGLLEQGVDVNLKRVYGWTPLHRAAEGGHVDVVLVLLDQGADVNAKAEDGSTPLHRAAWEGRVDVVSVLLDHGADVNVKDNGDITPLHWAAGGGHVDVVLVLLDHGADVNAKNNDGWTPLHGAAGGGRVGSVSVLLDHGADVNAKDKNGENPLQYAVFYPIYSDRPEISKFLKNTDLIKISDLEQKQRFEETVRKVIQEFNDIPDEVIAMGLDRVNQYRHNLRKGSLPSYHIRCMVVGHFGVGKTTLVKTILGKNEDTIQSTDGIDVYRGLCYVDIESGEWIVQEKHSDVLIGVENYIMIDFWDFAGQALYYNTHQTYLSYRCLYLLTINLELGLQSEVKDVHLDPEKRRKSKVIDFLHFWIGSIIHYSGRRDKTFPRIVIIGTHRDKFKDERKLDELAENIRTAFNPLWKSGQLIVQKDLFIDAVSLAQKDLDRIQKIIVKIGASYPTYGEQIPKDCIMLQQKLKYWRVKKQAVILTLSNLQNSLNGEEQTPESEQTPKQTLVSSAGVENNDRKAVEDMDGKTIIHRRRSGMESEAMNIDDMYLYLELYHSLGQILFMNENVLREKVILDPKWLIEAMRCLITRRKMREGSIASDRKMGELKKSDVLELWKDSKKEFLEHSEYLLLSMEKLDLICTPKAYDDTGYDKAVDFYYVPSMVELSGPVSAKPLGHREETVSYNFEGNLLPPAVFYRLVCHSLTLWTVYKSHLFCDQVSLVIDKEHLLHLRRKGNTVEVSFFFLKSLDETIVYNTKRYISETLNRVLKSYISAKVDGSGQSWYDITEGRGHLETSDRRTKEKGEFLEKGDTYSKDVSPIDDTSDFTEKQLMLIAWSVEEQSQDEVQRRLRSELPAPSKTSYRYEEFDVSEIILLLLGELKTYNKNHGLRTTAMSLTQYIDQKTIQVALQHHRKQDTAVPKLKQSLTHQMLDSVAMVVGYKAFPVGICLGLTIDEILLKRKDHVGDTLGFIQKLLRYWMSSKIKEATVEKLAEVLIETNCRIDPLLED